MNKDYTPSEVLEERLEKLEEVNRITRTFVERNIVLPLNESEVLLELEEAVLEAINYGWEIESVLEDEKLSPFEYDKIANHLDKLLLTTDELSKNDKENILILNKIVKGFNAIKDLIKEVEYVEDVNSVLGQYPTPDKKTGYVIEETSYIDAINAMNSLLKISKSEKTTEKKSKLERELINLSKFLGLANEKLVMNVIYTKPPILMSEIKASLEIITATLGPIYEMIRGKYFREEIKSAKIGLSLLAEDRNLKIGDSVKINRLFSRKKAIG
ncbi:MAG: hypothetical protein ACFFDS_09915, partial [Candidatus Thorarchaeota archaeon]